MKLRQFKRVICQLPLLVLSAVVLNCSSTPSDTKSEEVKSTTQAVTAPSTRTISLSFTVPGEVAYQNVSVGASQAANIADRVFTSAAVASPEGTVVIGNDAVIKSVVAKQDIHIGDRSQISGDVTTAGLLFPSPSATIGGKITTGKPLKSASTLAWTVQTPESGVGSVGLEPDTFRDLSPASYGDLSVKSRAQLALHAGVYYFGQVTIEPQGVLLIDNSEGPVQVYVGGGFTYRGVVQSARVGLPQLLVGVVGNLPVTIEAPFDGIVVAPNSDVHLQAAQPQGHRGAFFGKTTSLEPDTQVGHLGFQWDAVLGASAVEKDDGLPIYNMPTSDRDLTVHIEGNGSGPHSATSSNSGLVNFRLPQQFTVAGGYIGNGTAIFSFRNAAGTQVKCTYQGGSPAAQPASELDLLQGLTLHFQSCTDNLPWSTTRQGSNFGLQVNPVPGFPVTVNSPALLQQQAACSDELELLSPEQTRQMYDAFNWNNAHHVQERNADGKPAVYYGWIFVRNTSELLALRKLYIHLLTRPLFDEELVKYAGRCGTFTNRGDGRGTFVPVVIPGTTYNKLIDVRTSPDVSGDRNIFDAVILRTVPSAARNSNGSISWKALLDSGFVYLGYETRPLPDWNTMQLGSGASKALSDAMEWVATAAKNIGEEITQGLAYIQRLLKGSVDITLRLRAITKDPLYGNNAVMIRGWGPYANNPLGATGLQVAILQKLLGTPIPITSEDNTNVNGNVTISVAKNTNIRGTGICIELKSSGAMVTDWLIANDICDFRTYDPTTGNTNTVQIPSNIPNDVTYVMQIDNTRIAGLYEADDVFRYDDWVLGFRPKQARILSGGWADTISREHNPDDGFQTMFTSCLNYGGNVISDTALATMLGAAGALVSVPVIGTAAAAVVAVASSYANALLNTDIVMPVRSATRHDRGVMSHEYGHYTFCGFIHDFDQHILSDMIFSSLQTQMSGNDLTVPVRYINEAMAEYFMGQVMGGANYYWMDDGSVRSPHDYNGNTFQMSAKCDNDGKPCWDKNYYGVVSSDVAKGNESIGRVATLIHDMFDGQNARGQDSPDDGDSWTGSGSPELLSYSQSGYGNMDSNLERVALPGSSLRTFVNTLFINGMLSMNDLGVHSAAAATMGAAGYSWCDACRVLALHAESRTGNENTVQELWKLCQTDPNVLIAMGPAPEANLRLDANTCQICPSGYYSDADGNCKQCNGGVLGNTCQACPADVVLDGATLNLTGETIVSGTAQAPSDPCPDVVWVEIDNIAALFSRIANGATIQSISAKVSPQTCGGTVSLFVAQPSSGGFTANQTIVGQTSGGCTAGAPFCPECTGEPSVMYTASQLSSPTLVLGTPADSNNHLVILPSILVNPQN